MLICFVIGGQRHCFFIPIIEWPWPWLPGPGPHPNYPQLIQDASFLGSVQASLKNVSDDGVRAALHSGINAALKALQTRAGEHVTITQTAAK
jgi:hypothetical protein